MDAGHLEIPALVIKQGGILEASFELMGEGRFAGHEVGVVSAHFLDCEMAGVLERDNDFTDRAFGEPDSSGELAQSHFGSAREGQKNVRMAREKSPFLRG